MNFPERDARRITFDWLTARTGTVTRIEHQLSGYANRALGFCDRIDRVGGPGCWPMMRDHFDHHPRALGFAGGSYYRNVDVVVYVYGGNIGATVDTLGSLLASDLGEACKNNFIALTESSQRGAICRWTVSASERMLVLVSEWNTLIALHFLLKRGHVSNRYRLGT